MTRALLLSLPMMAACGPQRLVGAETTGDPGETTTTESPTSTRGTASSSGETSSSTSEPGSEEDSSMFAGPGDGPPPSDECDMWMQDCPEGQKCSFYANDGGTSWNALKCVPVMEDPAQVGEPCFVVGNAVSGLDNCVFGAFCWHVGQDNEGQCAALCTGSPEAPECTPGTTCAIRSTTVNLCLPNCDPLLQSCEADEVCVDSQVGGFICLLDASGPEGQPHDSCTFGNSCDPGLMCTDSSAAEECDQQAIGCCEPFCDVTLAKTCPGVGQVCNPWFEPGEAPAGFEAVGFCAVPR